ncbi:hypothetical protein GA0111570_104272 [Raineyella antarctica]|uniref:Uncharacterized protein n=1 Tax=Raineyella antarctica TaxID=1577474 RepID=A0A1G6GQE3_9ACTN|nr:hypothetical protein [Raineyella antarctica]SDB84262.1 hypothetical protein GA0111570_104272 [Raineyella antarctica]
MTVIPMGVAPLRHVGAAGRARLLAVDLSDLLVRAGSVLERLFTLGLLALMVVAGIVIAWVTFGVMTGLID